jgi:hypothetical protein
MARWNPDIHSLLNNPAETDAPLLILDGNRLGLKLFLSESIHSKKSLFFEVG